MKEQYQFLSINKIIYEKLSPLNNDLSFRFGYGIPSSFLLDETVYNTSNNGRVNRHGPKQLKMTIYLGNAFFKFGTYPFL